jgi:hypothetical protein
MVQTNYCVCLCICGGGDNGSSNFYTGCRKTIVGLFEEVVIVAVSIFTQVAGKLMCVCLCVCAGGGSGFNNFNTGCRKSNVCVSVFLWRWGKLQY